MEQFHAHLKQLINIIEIILNNGGTIAPIQTIKSRRMRWAGHVACMGEERGVHRFLVGKPEGKRPLGRPRCRWEDIIKRDLKEVAVGTGWSRLRIGTDGGHL
jgi:hypothetical protein